jgi:hypothetical protein
VRELDRQGRIEQRVHERQIRVLQVVVVDGTAYIPHCIDIAIFHLDGA